MAGLFQPGLGLVVSGWPVPNVQKSLKFAAHAVIVLGIAYTVAQATWFFVSGPAPLPASAARPQPDEGAAPSPGGSGREQPPIEQLAAQHLFGQPAPDKPPSRAATEALRETQLSLELIGVFVADDDAASTALIARKGKPAEIFGIGDRLPGNAKLTTVYRDRVVITRGESRELIVFDKPDGWIASSPTPLPPPRQAPASEAPLASAPLVAPSAAAREPATSAPAERSAPVQELARNYERDPRRDPRHALEELGVVAEDGVSGYTLGAVAERPELSHAGLRRGDRILSVNGRPVGGAESDWRPDGLEIDNLLALGSASLEIQRGQRRFVVTVALD